MSCGCKNVRDTSVPDAKLMSTNKSINTNTIFKWLIFIGMVVLSPLFLPFFISFLYKLIIKNQNMDMTHTLKSIVELMKTSRILNTKSDIDIVDLELYDNNSKLELVNV